MSKKFSFFYSLCKNKIFIKFIIEFLQILYKYKVSIISIFTFILLNIVFTYIYFNFNYLPLSSEPLPYISLIGAIFIVLTIVLILSILGLLGLYYFTIVVFVFRTALIYYFLIKKPFKNSCIIRVFLSFSILLDLLTLLLVNQNILFLLLSLISFLTLISLYIFTFYLKSNLDKLKTKSIDGNLILMTIHISLVFGFFLLTLFKKFLFPQGNIYLKGEICYIVKQNIDNAIEIYTLPIQKNSLKTLKVWCKLKNVTIFWKDSQNIYVHLKTNKGKYSFPIKREFILQEPLIFKKVFKLKKQTEQSKSTTKGENKNISQNLKIKPTPDGFTNLYSLLLSDFPHITPHSNRLI